MYRTNRHPLIRKRRGLWLHQLDVEITILVCPTVARFLRRLSDGVHLYLLCPWKPAAFTTSIDQRLAHGPECTTGSTVRFPHRPN